MTEGQRYLLESGLVQLEYEKAIQENMNELIGILQTNNMELDDLYEDNDITIYPQNVELYDFYVDNAGFDMEGYLLFLKRRIENRY